MKKCTQIGNVRSTNKNFPQIDRVRSTINSMSEINKPLVSILLAVYKPNEQWLIEQLISLNEQNYPNLDLLIYDDCPEYPLNESLIGKYITKFNYKIIRGKENKGSNYAFEQLTKIADGEYFAYCDQDDIWEKNKISIMMEKFKEKDMNLVCCDLCIINEIGIKTHNSIRDIRKRIVYKSGYNIAKSLFVVNFVTGCAMIVKREIAIKSIPFLKELVHDQWIAIVAAIDGQIGFINKPLVKYRQHSMNQTGILKDVIDKNTYYIKRIDDFIIRYESIKGRLYLNDDLEKYINNLLVWLNARKQYSKKISIKELKTMIKYKDFHKVSILIECLLPFIPDFMFKYIIRLAKKGLL